MKDFETWVKELYENEGVDRMIDEIIKTFNCAPNTATGTPSSIVRTTYAILNGETDTAITCYTMSQEEEQNVSIKDLLKRVCSTIKNNPAIPIVIADVANQAKKLSGLEVKMLYYVGGIVLLTTDIYSPQGRKYISTIEDRLRKLGRDPKVTDVNLDELISKYKNDPIELCMEFFGEKMCKSRVRISSEEFVEDLSAQYDTQPDRRLLSEKWEFETLKAKVVSDFIDGNTGDSRESSEQRQSDIESLLYLNKKDEYPALLELVGILVKYHTGFTVDWFRDVLRIGLYIIRNCYVDLDVNPSYDGRTVDYSSCLSQGKNFLGIKK